MLYDRWHRDGVELDTYTILTTAPNELMADIHNRMPVILGKDEEDEWLDPATSIETARARTAVTEVDMPVGDMEGL